VGCMVKRMAEYLSIAILGVALFAPRVCAQQTDPRVNPPVAPQKPLPTNESSAKAPGEAAGAPEQTPDTSPLSGAELFTLGQLGKTRSYTLASFQVFESADTNVAVTSTKTSLSSATTLLGHIGLHRVRGRYQLTTDYQGGYSLYSPRSDLNTSIHDFGLSQRIAWRRWSLLLRDQLSYLPEASFGLSAGQGGTISQDLNPIVVPNQSILTSRTQRISNTAVAELQHVLSRKSSVTASASYAILQFVNSPSFLNNRNAVFLIGYEYSPSPRNSLALNYGFSIFRYGGQGRGQVYDHMVHAAYGRRITGRLALELSAGPELYVFKSPASQNNVSRSSTRLNWGMESTLRYRWPKTNLRITHASYLNGGAGVVAGAQTPEVRLTADQQLSRVWRGTLDLGFARNSSLPETTSLSTPVRFDALFGGVGLRRQLGRHMNLSLSYRALRQHAVSGCTPSAVGLVTTCSNLPVRHHFDLGLEWRNRQLSLD
jgi:hypothetical protein